MEDHARYIITRLLEIDSQTKWRVFSKKDSQLAGMLLRHLIESDKYQTPDTAWGKRLTLELRGNTLTYKTFRQVMDDLYSELKTPAIKSTSINYSMMQG